MLFDLLSIAWWGRFRIYSVQFCCITLDSMDNDDRCLLAVAFVDGQWMLDVFFIHILTRG